MRTVTYWVTVMVRAAQAGDLLTVKRAEAKLINLKRTQRKARA